MELSYAGLQDRKAFAAAGIQLPKYDWKQMAEYTHEHPVWVHFGAGNIFRGFIAALQQHLLENGMARSGIVAAETFDYDIIHKIYQPHDSMTLMVTLLPDGSTQKEVIASIAQGLAADAGNPQAWGELKRCFAHPELQMVSFTITEKGYALTSMRGDTLPVVLADMEHGPDAPRHAMSCVTAMLWHRFQAGGAPLALVSMDNCSHNGEKLRSAVLTIAKTWAERGHVSQAFVDYVADESRVSFPWSMIDKITPRPAQAIQQQLAEAGMEGMEPVITSKHTYIAPFVNAEAPQYLVVEDRFPNGRPPLEKAGVYMTDRATVNMTERMKVTTCLNPLHTGLAVYGCLLGYTSIAAEMRDELLVKLVKTVGYAEGLPVVTDPGIISPKAFIDEVVQQRLPNPFIPDTPQRIATDTSQKIAIRFGETIKSYMADAKRDAADLNAIPLVLAGWLRYLLAVDDQGNPMPVSADPLLAQLQAQLSQVKLGQPESAKGCLQDILANPVLFGVDLYQAGLAEKVEAMFMEELAGAGAVRATLERHL